LISTKTGIKPFCIMGLTVVGKPAAAVITSSPFFNLFFSGILKEVRAVIANKLAEEPELTKVQNFFPIKPANLLSNSAALLPSVHQPSIRALTPAIISSSLNTFPETGIGDFPGTNGF